MHVRFLLGLLVPGVFALACLTGCVTANNTKNNTTSKNLGSGFPIVQGLTNAHATQIAVVAPVATKLEFTMAEQGAKAQVPNLKVETHSSTTSDFVVHHLQIDGLKVGSNYRLFVRNLDGNILDEREFQALDLSARNARIVAISCLFDGFVNESKVMWKALLDAKPDLLLMIGDNVYAEMGNGEFKSPLSEKGLWLRYVQTFQALDFYRTKDLVPTLVTWDDHDYGMSDGNREHPFKADAQKVQTAFFPQSASKAFPEITKGPGVSSKFDAFGSRFLLLDDRSFRSPKDQNEQTHFGLEQEKWIFENVRSSRRPVWLISGDQWFGGYHRFESYEGSHPKSFQTFLKNIRKQARKLVVFVSGDRHLSEVMQIEKEVLGFTTYEFTSSALHSKMYPGNWDQFPNKRQIRGIDLHSAFTYFDLAPISKSGLKLKGAAIGPESKVLYSFDLEVTGP